MRYDRSLHWRKRGLLPKKHKRPTLPIYGTQEELMLATNFRKCIKDYHDTPFYTNLAQLKVKYEIMRDLLEINK